MSWARAPISTGASSFVSRRLLRPVGTDQRAALLCPAARMQLFRSLEWRPCNALHDRLQCCGKANGYPNTPVSEKPGSAAIGDGAKHQ
jgi:hypothetical protein